MYNIKYNLKYFFVAQNEITTAKMQIFFGIWELKHIKTICFFIDFSFHSTIMNHTQKADIEVVVKKKDLKLKNVYLPLNIKHDVVQKLH